MVKNTLMNIVTIVAYCMIFLFAVSGCTVFTLWVSGSFNTNTEPVAGLKFNVDEIVISENGGTAEFKVLSSQAEVTGTGENQIINDPAQRVDVRVEIWDSNGKVQESNLIVSFDETGKLCDTLTITALLADDEYNKGGSCFLHAYTADDLYFATPIPIYVDVPIESVDLLATDKVSGEVFELDPLSEDYTKFVKGDEFIMTIQVVPSRALKPFGVQDKLARYFSSVDVDFVSVETSSNKGLVYVKASNDRSGEVELSVEIPRTYANPTDLATSELTIDVALLEMDKIDIRNETILQQGTKMSLFGESSTKLSARDTGDDDVTSLNLFLEPKYYNQSTNADPLEDRLQSRDIKLSYYSSVESGNSVPIGLPSLFTIIPNDVEGENNIIWNIVPNREMLEGESANFTISYLQPIYDENGAPVLDEFNKPTYNKISADFSCSVNIVVPEKSDVEFFDSKENKVITSLALNITKETQGDAEVVKAEDNKNITNTVIETEPGLLRIADCPNGIYTYSKIVYFVSNKYPNLNPALSKIVNATDSGQIKFTDKLENIKYNEYLQPLGAGSIEIIPYLIRTDKDGNPINAKYQVISDIESVSGVGESGADNEYILIREYAGLKIIVGEELTSLTLYSYESLDDGVELDKTTEYYLGTTANNKVTLYARGNSALSVPSQNNNDIVIAINVEQEKPVQLNVNNIEFTNVTIEGMQINIMRFNIFAVVVGENFGLNTASAQIFINQNLVGGKSYTNARFIVKEVLVTEILVDKTESATNNNIFAMKTGPGYSDFNVVDMYGTLYKPENYTEDAYKVAWNNLIGRTTSQHLPSVNYTPQSVNDFTVLVEGEEKTLYHNNLVATRTNYEINPYYYELPIGQTIADAHNILKLIDKSKIAKNGDNLYCTLSSEYNGISAINLINASAYFATQNVTYNNISEYYVQFKMETPDNYVPVMMFEYAKDFEAVFNPTGSYITRPDFIVLNPTFPSIDFGSVSLPTSLNDGTFGVDENTSNVLDINENWGNASYSVNTGLAIELNFELDASGGNYFELVWNDVTGKYQLMLKAGCVMTTHTEVVAAHPAYIQQNITQITLSRYITIVLDILDTNKYHYTIVDSVEIQLPTYPSENNSPIFTTS